MIVTSEKLVMDLPAHNGSRQHDSLIVEFRDHIMMLEAGQSEARALAYIAEAKKLFRKSQSATHEHHAHADHTGGLPAMVAEGATVITQKNNEQFSRKPQHAANASERHAREDPKKAQIEAVSEKKGTRTEHERSRCTTWLRCLTRTA